MALLLVIGLYALALGALAFIVHLDIPSAGLLLAVQIATALGVLVLPIVAYSAIDRSLTRGIVERIGRAWCSENSVDYVRTEIHKNHFSVIYRRTKPARQNFRLRFVPTTWTVKSVEWL